MTASRVAILAMLLGSVGAWTVVAQSSPHQKMLDALRQVANLTSETNSYLGDGPANRARRDLDALSSSAHARERWRLTM